jgi:LysM repeat protein
MTTILIPDNCDAVLASISAVTPTPESAESLTTATFTPVAGQSKTTATPFASVTVTPTVVPDQTYTIVYGDRLTKIAEKFGLTVACIATPTALQP